MDEKDHLIEQLRQQVNKYERRVHYLENLLQEADISYKVAEVIDSEQPVVIEENQGDRILQEIITKNHARFFYTMFKGRTDVYSKRAGKANNKTGKTGYYTQCWNFWKDGIYPKRTGKQVKCGECSKQSYKKLIGEDILNHLIGARNDCSDVIGLYPMLEDETCNFLVFDFDNHHAVANGKDSVNQDNGWVDEVNAMRLICQEHEVPILVERSRSGKGAHIWMFFEEPVKAYVARKFGAALLTKGAESVNQKGFQSYDRMVPTQDNLPPGGLGNLVALPLQGQALKNGNSAFIDENWNAYPDQWKILKETNKLSKVFIEEKSKEWAKDGVLGILADDMSGCKEDHLKETSKPWEQKGPRLESSDVDGVLSITMSNQIYIGIENVKPRMQNQIRRLAAFSNPEYYKTQAMGFLTRGIPRIIACSQEYDKFIGIPRGCKGKLEELLKSGEILCREKDNRQKGKRIAVSFRGELYQEQKKLLQKC